MLKFLRKLKDKRVKTFAFWSGRRDSNPRLQPWQGCALPLSYARSKPLLARLTLSVTSVSQGEMKWQHSEKETTNGKFKLEGLT